ncbi:MAG: family 1 encapsulin nanocompartment shell protein [Bacteroidales bacterium]
MDILRKSLAPITEVAWEEINDQARVVFQNVLTARRFADVEGPKGFAYGGVSLGRLNVDSNQKEDAVKYGINRLQPLMETRKSFKLNIWELDNVVRGAADVDLEAMEKAAKEMGQFEERAIYLGFEKACIQGLKEVSDHDVRSFPQDGKEILKTLANSISAMRGSFVEGPYHLVLGTDKWQNLHIHTGGYPLKRQVEDLIGGEIILNPNVEEGFLVSGRGGDFQLILGQDIAIGYESHNEKEVQLYFTESFTFRTLEPAAVIVFE